MSKVIDITDKLSFDEPPQLKVGDITVTVNDSAESMLKLMGLVSAKDTTESDLITKGVPLLFGKEDEKKLKGLLSLKDFMVVIQAAMELARGGEEEESGE